MKKSRFTESQIVSILKEGEAGPKVAEIYRKHGISGATTTIGKPGMAGPRCRLLKQVRELATENAQAIPAGVALEPQADSPGVALWG